MTWYPSATFETLRKRAAILATIRTFFAERHFLEVETPLLTNSLIPDPYLAFLTTEYQGKIGYLQPSPESYMKRLLAAGSGSIYQISKAFRHDEQGRLHQPEFTMLEWYQLDYDHHQLMDQTDQLLQATLDCEPADRRSYRELFLEYLSIDPQQATINDLQTIATQYHITLTTDHLDHDDWLSLLMSHLIEPHLGKEKPIFIYDYPASQAALSIINQDTQLAERFEVYYHGIELANGFHELDDPNEQQQRFINDNAQSKTPVPIDHQLLAALSHGLPHCAGIALGIDRLVLLATGKKHIDEVIAFTGC